MVFQSYALYPHMTVRQNIAFPLTLAKMKKDEIAKKVDEAAKILDLTDFLDRKPGQLSGGQRQRVAMGRAIVRDPKAFLMDEPLFEPRRQAAGADALGDRPAAAPVGHHHRLRHARPDRGDDAGGSGGGHAWRGGTADRRARRALQQPGQPVRRGFHRIAVDELLPGHPHRRRGAPAVRRTSRSPRKCTICSRDTQAQQRDRRCPARASRGRRAARRVRPHPGADASR